MTATFTIVKTLLLLCYGASVAIGSVCILALWSRRAIIRFLCSYCRRIKIKLLASRPDLSLPIYYHNNICQIPVDRE